MFYRLDHAWESREVCFVQRSSSSSGLVVLLWNFQYKFSICWDTLYNKKLLYSLWFYNKYTCREVIPRLDAPRVAGSFSNSPSEASWVLETSSHPKCVQSRTCRTCKCVWFLSHFISVKSTEEFTHFSIQFLVWITNILAAKIIRKQTNLGLNKSSKILYNIHLFLKRENAHIQRKHCQDIYKPARAEQIPAAIFLLYHFQYKILHFHQPK